MNLCQLREQFAQHPGIQIQELTPNYPVIQINNQRASAEIALHGAHVTSFTPKKEQAIIFTSDKAIYKEGKAIRGGVPICWPWFNAHPDNANYPSHGFARNRFWQLKEINASDDTTKLTFTCPLDEDDFTMIGGRVTAEATITIGEKLTIDLTTTNCDQKTLNIGGALHSYFSLSNITDVTVSGLDQTSHLDALTGNTSIHQGDITFSEEYDRVFIPTTTTTKIHDPNWDRNIIVEKSGSGATVVWNPWIDKSAGMADLGNEDYKHFLCIEALNWREDLREITPGASHTLSQSISVERFTK